MAIDKKLRISRLAAIQTLLLSKRLITAHEIANKFGVSIRTIYRDIKVLEDSGLPIVTEEGKGYRLIEGYLLPPIMFSEKEAFALITSEQLIVQNKDASLAHYFTEAINKIRSVLKQSNKQKAEFLKSRVHIGKNFANHKTSNSLLDVQIAMTNHQLIRVQYTNNENQISERILEPCFIYHSVKEDWTLHAYCRMRKEFRTFRFDRMIQLKVMDEFFTPHTFAHKTVNGKKWRFPVKSE